MVKNTKNTGRNIIPIKHDRDNQPGLSDKCRNVMLSLIYILFPMIWDYIVRTIG